MIGPCGSCNSGSERPYVLIVEGARYCQRCFDQEFSFCNVCKSVLLDSKSGTVCDECFRLDRKREENDGTTDCNNG